MPEYTLLVTVTAHFQVNECASHSPSNCLSCSFGVLDPRIRQLRVFASLSISECTSPQTIYGLDATERVVLNQKTKEI